MTTPSSSTGNSSVPVWSPNAESYYRPALFAAIASSVGVIVGSFTPWLSYLMFTVNGLDFANWGTATLILGALSGLALVTVMFWERTPFDARWALAVAWGIVVAGVACLTDAVINIVRIMTIPKANLFGAMIGVSVGWGLWLVAFSSMVMCVTAVVVASQIAKSVELVGPLEESGTSWPQRWRWAAIITSALIVIAGIVYAWTHPWKDESGESSTSMLPSFPSSPSLPTGSTTTSSTSLAAAPTTAARTATDVITAAAVVNGQPANGYQEAPPLGNANEVSMCDASPAALAHNIYGCAPSAAGADVCWPSTPGTLLCIHNPWDNRLFRVTYTDPLQEVRPPANPMPFALVLDDGTQCRLRNGGAWGGRDDGLVGAYGCPGENPAVLEPQRGGTPAIDRSQPLWTVKVGALGPVDRHFPPPKTHAVTTAWFAGN